MKDLYKAIDVLNEISQAERDAMRAQIDADEKAARAALDAEKAAVMKAAGKSAPTKADMYKDVADFAKQQRAQSKADGYATRAEYDAAYQKNLDNLADAGIKMDDVFAAADKMMSTEKGAARLAKMGINDTDDLISYTLAKAGIKDVTPDKYTVTDYAITDDITIESEEALDERVTYSTLAKLSGIKNPDKIRPGQKITLPGGGSYTVKRGDTLSAIAQDYRLGNIGKSGKLDDPTTKLPQVPKYGKLDDPTTKLPQVSKKNIPFRDAPDVEPGDFYVNYDKKDAGDDTDDRLNKYAFLRTPQGGDYKIDPKSVKQPPAKAPSKSLYKQFGDFVKGTKTKPTTSGSVMDLARQIEADPTFQAKSDSEKQADIAQMAANNAAQRAEIYRRLKNR